MAVIENMMAILTMPTMRIGTKVVADLKDMRYMKTHNLSHSRKRGIMKKSRNHISREQIRIALDRFYAQGGQIRVLPPQQIEADSNYHISQKLEEFELFDKTTLLPTDLDNALRNSLFTNPLMDPQDKL